jgi:hypothetical protein
MKQHAIKLNSGTGGRAAGILIVSRVPVWRLVSQVDAPGTPGRGSACGPPFPEEPVRRQAGSTHACTTGDPASILCPEMNHLSLKFFADFFLIY